MLYHNILGKGEERKMEDMSLFVSNLLEREDKGREMGRGGHRDED